MRIFFNTIIIQIVISVYIFWRGWQILPNKKYLRIPYVAIFVLEFLIYLIGFFGSTHLPPNILQPIAWICTTWMVFVVYLSALLIAYDILRYLTKKWTSIPNKYKLKSLKTRRIYFCLSILFVISIMAYGNYKFWHPTVTELTLEIDKSTPNIKELKVVVASDMHVGYLIDKKILKMYVDKILEQKPDLILLVGDIIDYDLKSVIDQQMEKEFQRLLQAPYGVYASTGNHEYIWVEGDDRDYKINWLAEQAKLNVLRDSAVLINNSIYLVGREDDNFTQRKPLKEIIKDIDKKRPIIVLNHEPHNLKEETSANVDIALYGHTHDGQLFPYNLVIKLLYEVSHGYKKKDNTHIYVSSGLGLSGPQYRIGTISEIVVLNIKFTK